MVRLPPRPAAALTPALSALSFTVIAFVAAACSSGKPGPTPTPPPPVVSPVPSTVSADIALGDRLYIQGEIDRALEVYSAAVLRGAPGDRQEAVWKVARIQFEKGQHQAASQNARAYLGTSPDIERRRQALLLLGYSEMAQGRNKPAEDAFKEYLSTAGPAAPYASLQLAELASRRGDAKAAASLAQDALDAGLPDAVRTGGLFALARYQEAAGDQAAALATYESLASDGATASDRAEALWNMAAVAREMRDEAREQQALRELVLNYPGHDRALEALNSAPPVTASARAYVLFLHRANDDATAAYQSLASDPDPVVRGEAHYYLGILAERAGDPGEALNQYGAAIDALSGTGSQLLGDAYWDRGLVFEAAGRLEEAAQSYAAIAGAVPGHARALEGLFRAGLVRYRQGLPQDAITSWDAYTQLASGAEEARGRFWLARAYLSLGDSAAQAQNLEQAVTAAPLAYYGLRARAVLDVETAAEDPAQLAAQVPDWAAIETWLTGLYGAEDTVARQTFEASPAWQRGLELVAAAQFQAAAEEIGPLADTTPDNWARYRIARAMYEAGQIRLAARAAQTLVAGADGAPAALLALVYPARFAGQATEAASREGVSPFLLLALVRQESFFDPGAVSSAGAMGLTQVIPSTAAGIAAELAEPDFKDGDLLQPDVALRFGAHYLAAQVDAFGGNLQAALAAYNGGPGNAGRWAGASGGDPDLLLEVIDFSETRVYVEVVMENYALYRYIYGAADHPSLP